MELYFHSIYIFIVWCLSEYRGSFYIEVLWDLTPCLLVIVIGVALSNVRVVHCFWGCPEDGGSKLLENVGELFTDRHVINQKNRIFSTIVITSNFAMTTSLEERIEEFLTTQNRMCGL